MSYDLLKPDISALKSHKILKKYFINLNGKNILTYSLKNTHVSFYSLYFAVTY